MGPRSPRRPLLACAAALSAAAFGVGCDSAKGGKDAAAASSQRMSEVSVRVDVPAGGAPSVSVLAYRANISGLGAHDVLSVVDPLVGQPPEGGCELRDVAGGARSLAAMGGRVELDSFGPISVELDAGSGPLRPLPRVYPDLASAVGGVIGEAGPVDVPAAPEALSLVTTAPGEAPVIERRLLPPAPRVLTAEGEPLGPQFKLDPSADLTLQVQAPPRTFIELRPFGATLALACAIEGGRVFISADHLARLTGPSGRAPVSVEAVWRDSQATALAGRPHRLSVEVRASAVVELRR